MRSERVHLAAGVVVQAIGEEALVLELNSENVFSLNPTGARIVEMLQADGDVDHVIHALAGEYGLSAEAIADDVHALLDALAARGLVIRVSGQV